MHLIQGYSPAFRKWLSETSGSNLIALESQKVGTVLPTIFGYYAVILGESNFAECLQVTSVKNKVLISPKSTDTNDNSTLSIVRSRHDKIPIGNELVDLVYIAHSLEFSNNPHEVLREAYRILRPDGRLIITMFNPLSIWGLWRKIASLRTETNWKANFIMLHRLKDWLALLGFDIMRINNFGFCLPFKSINIESASLSNISWAERLGQKLELPFAAGYLIEASKRIIPVTPIRPVWATEKAVITEDAAEPTV